MQAASVGAQLRLLRKRAGLSQEALAERAGLGVTTLKALERNARQRPHRHTLERLCDALGLPDTDRALLLEFGVASGPSLNDGPPPAVVAGSFAPSARLVRLPLAFTALIGRDAELGEARALLDPRGGATRLLTFVGPGGVGKTRLALAVAADLADAFHDGAVFVDLGGLRDARLVAATIARSLDMREGGGRSARELLTRSLRNSELLLLLDNFEHLLPAAPLLAELVAACPRLALLVTSRASLRLRDEQRFVVRPLTVPDSSHSFEAIAASPAVRLFSDRAQAADPDFKLEPTTASDVAEVCRRLDGLPLAIELAAARVGLLGPAALLTRLQRRLPLLTVGAADLPPRQQTLRTTLMWSYDLLEAAEQALFRRLSVFVGGWTLEAAEAITPDAALPAVDVLDGLQALADSSLIQRQDHGTGDQRFEMLETVREYVLGRLDESGEAPVVRDRHLEYFLRLAEEATVQLFGPKLPESLASLDGDLGNLRAALEWGYAHGQTALCLRLAGALAPFWSTRGYGSEGLAWLNRLLAEMHSVTLPEEVAARTLYGAGVLANSQGDLQRAMEWLDHAIELYRQAGDAIGAVRALNTRSGVDYDRGDLQGAMSRLEQCVSLARAANDAGELARALANLGEVHFHLDELERASDCYREALGLARRAGRVDIEAYQLSDLANLACRRGDFATARSLHQQALRLKRMLGDHRRIAISLEEMAALAVAEGQMAQAAYWLGAASELRAHIGTPLPAPERVAIERTVAAARAVLDEAAWDTAFAAGRSLPLAEVVSEALGEEPPEAASTQGK